MARNFLTLALENKTQCIGFWVIIKNDILPWFASAGFALLLFLGVLALVSSAQPNMSDIDASANLYTWALPFYYALIALVMFLARRTRDMWTWIFIVVLALFFVNQSTASLSTVILPSSILYAMVAMLGLLAFGRIVEYIYLRHTVKLSEPHLSYPAYATYISVVVMTAILANSSLFYRLLQG